MTTEKPRRNTRKPVEAPEPAVEDVHVAPEPVEPRRGRRSVEEREALIARGCPLGLVEGTDPDAVLID